MPDFFASQSHTQSLELELRVSEKIISVLSELDKSGLLIQPATGYDTTKESGTALTVSDSQTYTGCRSGTLKHPPR